MNTGTSSNSNYKLYQEEKWGWWQQRPINSVFTGLHNQKVPSNKTTLVCGGMTDSHHIYAAHTSAAAGWGCYVNIAQNLKGTFPARCWIYSTKWMKSDEVTSECINIIWRHLTGHEGISMHRYRPEVIYPFSKRCVWAYMQTSPLLERICQFMCSNTWVWVC